MGHVDIMVGKVTTGGSEEEMGREEKKDNMLSDR